ncbi:Protein-S-isoprenylcysteine O-methyltransferase [[Candida] zeylanoides]
MYNPAKVNLAVVALKAMVLGMVFAMSAACALCFEPSVPVFAASAAVFHLSEFFCTSVYNEGEVDDDSFILNDRELLLVYAASVVEHAIRSYLWANPLPLQAAGLALMVVGQLFRSLAMCTAKESFNHYVQQQHRSQHKLVTHGVYAVSRHPSYFGFFWLVVGHQLWLGNVVLLAVCTYKLWRFFRARIEYEEAFLVKFFKEDYQRYRRHTSVGIPFI